MTPMLSFSGRVTSLQGMGIILGSWSQGSESTTVFAYKLKADRSADIGPLIERTASCPGSPERAPWVGNRPKEGLRE
jgi:hypothetical protein